MKSKTAVPVLVILFVVMLAVGLYGINSGSQEDLTVPANASSGKTAEELSETVFPKEKVIDVKITVNEADFQDMLDNASLEEFKMASVEYNGTKFDNVGIRTKGNLSLRSVVQMQDSDRYSFKLSFDEYVDNQTLAGISKINLNNNYSDASYMREFLTYELAEEMGLPTPGHSYVNVYINGKLWGFYLAVEQVGDAYLERNFGNSYGALYKGEMTGVGSDLAWLGDDLSKYTGLAQKSKSSNGEVLIEMLEELNNGTDYESVLNVDNVLKYIALNVATNNMDSYLGSNKQNYYLYEDDGIFNVLPWDYNMAFGGMGGMGGGRGMGGQNAQTEEGNANGADAAGQAQANAGAVQQGNGQAGQPGMGGQNAQTAAGASVLIDEPTQGAVAERPLIAKLLAVDEYKERYHTILKEISEGFLSETEFNAKVDGLAAKISAYVENDPTSFYTYEEYLKGVEQLKTANTTMITSVIQQLNGTIASTNNGQGSGGGMGGGRGMGGMRGGAGETNGQQQGGFPQRGGQNGQQQGGFPQQGGRDGQQPGGGQQNGQNGRQQQGGQMMPPDFGGEGGGAPGGMPGMPGGPGGQQAAQTGGVSEAVTAGALLLVMLAASWFILRFRHQH